MRTSKRPAMVSSIKTKSEARPWNVLSSSILLYLAKKKR